MTIQEAIKTADRLKPNQISLADKVAWLNVLDMQAWRDVLARHEEPGREGFDGYDEDTPADTELLILAPDDREIYTRWLWWHYDEITDEVDKYNADVTRFNAAYGEWMAWYNRTHMPLRGPSIRR